MSVSTRFRPVLRRAADRVAEPYVAQLRLQMDALRQQLSTTHAQPESAATELSAVATEGTMSDRFHMMNHELRTLELERLAGSYERVLSVGAQGSWYFEWFRRSVGDVVEHVGVEAYEPKPDDLPDYATWVTDTADRMVNVETSSVDLVFAGQTSEHLWAHELVGFLLEAHRVIRPGGRLVLDSPNRAVTEHLHWGHGGHTIELDRHEITELLEMAGFDVDEVAGIWRCRFGDDMLQLEDGLADPAIVTRRIALGRDAPDDCFVWWVNAHRSGRTPDADALARRIDQLFAAHWDTRASRGFFPGPTAALVIPAGRHDRIAATLPFPLHAGRWRIGLRAESGSWDDVTSLHVSIVAPGDHPIHELHLVDARRDDDRVSWVIEQPYLLFALSIVMSIETRDGLTIAAPLEVRHEGPA